MIDKADDFGELNELMSALVDDVITDDQFARLDQMLANDRRARQRFIQYVDLHSELAEGDALSTEMDGAPASSPPIPIAAENKASAAEIAKPPANPTSSQRSPPPGGATTKPTKAPKPTHGRQKSKPAVTAAAVTSPKEKLAGKKTARPEPTPPIPPPLAAAGDKDKATPTRAPKDAPPPSKDKTAAPAAVGGPSAAFALADADGAAASAPRKAFLSRVPGWLISTLVHAAAIIILALVPLAMHQMEQEISVVSGDDMQTEELEEMTFEIEPQELEELQMTATALTDPGAMDFGDLGLETELGDVSDGIGQLDDSPVGDIGVLFGEDGLGMSEIGEGKGAAMFFGVRVTGNRFCYVVDNSNSMNGGKFETAVFELVKSVRQLEKHQYFYVIFYSDTAYPLFYPETATGWVQATDQNKRKLEYWLMTVHRCLRTQGEEAMEMAFRMNPDAIYLLGDGAFGDKTVEKTLATDSRYTTIHTLGFKMSEKAAQGFRDVAAQFKGTFTEVAVTPAMVELSKRLKRPSNNSQNGVWGIKLGQKK